MNRQWLRNLATAEWKNGAWQLADPDNPSAVAHMRVQETLPILMDQMRDLVEAFNAYANSDRQLRLYKLSRSPVMSSCGLMILLGRIQVKLEQVGPKIKTEGILLQGYTTTDFQMRWFEPKFDTFGEVFWLMDGKVPMTLEKLCQQVIEDTLRLAFENAVLITKEDSQKNAARPAKKKRRSFLQW